MFLHNAEYYEKEFCPMMKVYLARTYVMIHQVDSLENNFDFLKDMISGLTLSNQLIDI